MNTLQKLIEELKVQKSKAIAEREDFYYKGNLARERVFAFDLAIDKAEQFLNAETQTTVKKPDAKHIVMPSCRV